MSQDQQKWQRQNLDAIKAKLAPHKEPEELAEVFFSDQQGIFLRRHETTIELYCFEEESKTLSGIMSRIDIEQPLNLLGVYSQAMLLAACWHASPPERAYIAGFGGGRLAMLLHHCFPKLQIDGSDLDNKILSLAQDYFGIEYDDRYAVNAADSRTDFDSRNGNYDIVFIDIFVEKGNQPDHLTDRDFFETCAKRLTSNGVVALNLAIMDPRFEEKATAFAQTFPFCHHWHQTGGHIFIGSREAPEMEDVAARAAALTQANSLSFPFAERVQEYTPFDARALMTA